MREENEWPCPECRTIQTKTVDGLTRPRFVERAVEKFKTQKSETKAACVTHGMPYSLCKFSVFGPENFVFKIHLKFVQNIRKINA